MPFVTDMQTAALRIFSAFMLLFGTIVSELLPGPVRSFIGSAVGYLFTSPKFTITVDENCGISRNQLYNAAQVYLRTYKITHAPKTKRFKVGKTSKQKELIVSIEKGEQVADRFENFDLNWTLVSVEGETRKEKRFLELSFNKKFKDRVLNGYLPFILVKYKEIKEKDNVVKLYTSCRDTGLRDDGDGEDGGGWASINLDHPATFDTVAMDPEMKKALIEDLNRFVARREFYKKVGKAWKRGYLLYGPPGTGKSTLIAAMANYLKFNIYDLELTGLYSNSQLRSILLSTTNRSIIVIEDIDCCDRQMMGAQQGGLVSSDNKEITLSGLLNFIDGLWSCCGDERIIIFTTNHKELLDPALLRHGRMDVHISMSYCTMQGFKLLASNYLDIDVDDHDLFDEIEDLLKNVEVTPAEIAEELMKNDNADIALGHVVNFLRGKATEAIGFQV